MTFVFLHGGPGFNSFAEQAMLGSLFHSARHEIVCWHEPSRIRPYGDVFDEGNAFECWLASAEAFVLAAARSAPVHLIAHSMSIHAAVEIVRRHPGCVRSLVLVAAAADAFVTFKNVLRLHTKTSSTHSPTSRRRSLKVSGALVRCWMSRCAKVC